MEAFHASSHGMRNEVHFFPAMARVDRSTFARQAATLWAVKERLWYLIRDCLLLSDPTLCVLFNLQDQAPPLQSDRWLLKNLAHRVY